MIQINLLPEVKQQYLRAQQMKHTFIVGSVLVSIAFLSFTALLFAYVQVVQPRHLQNVQTDIDSGLAQVQEVPKAVEIVTVQGALEQLPGLQDKKNISSRLFKYINGFTPKDISYAEVKLDLVAGTLSLRGETTNYEQTNVLANNLKSAEFTYTQHDQEQSVKPFSQVVFTNLGRAEQAQNGKSVSFQIDLKVDPILFNESVSKANLKVDARRGDLLIPSAKPFSSRGNNSGGAQ